MYRSKVGVQCGIALAALLFLATSANAQRQMEKLGRGVVAINQGGGKSFVSWRLLGTEPDSIAFNIYRATGEAPPVKLNADPITKCTCYQDNAVDLTKDNVYSVRPILNGQEGEASKPFLGKIADNTPAKQYIAVPLHPGLTPNDGSVGDLDGDGEYEIVLKREGRGRDPSRAGPTGETHLEAYKLDGTFMWKINLGINVTSGAAYCPFLVWDIDGDGKAEVVCRTADGTVDGAGKVIGDPKADWREPDSSTITQSPWMTNMAPVYSRPARGPTSIAGIVISGPEYLTVFDGQTGAARPTIPYVPPRYPGKLKPTTDELTSVWGSGMGNNDGRFGGAIAYLDGVHPSVVMTRGIYTRSVLAAFDWKDGKLVQRRVFDTDVPGMGKDGKFNSAYAGQGNHSLTVADVDHDGKDEIVYGACCIDDDGKGLYTTGWGHGDAEHVSAFDPNNTDLQIFDIHEVPTHPYSVELHDAATGKLIWGYPGKMNQPERWGGQPDVGRAMAANCDPRYPGAVFFGLGTHDLKGNPVQVTGASNFGIWWDGDLFREFLNSNQITKWNWEANRVDRIFTAEGCTSNNGSKSTPTLSADIFGDWREELMEATSDGRELRIFTTVIPTENRLYTLMHDPQYRQAIVTQNVEYNQPPWTSFFLGNNMKPPPKPNIVLVSPQ